MARHIQGNRFHDRGIDRRADLVFAGFRDFHRDISDFAEQRPGLHFHHRAVHQPAVALDRFVGAQPLSCIDLDEIHAGRTLADMDVFPGNPHELVGRVTDFIENDIFVRQVTKADLGDIRGREDLVQQFVAVFGRQFCPGVLAFLCIHVPQVFFIDQVLKHIRGDINEVAGSPHDALPGPFKQILHPRILRGEFIEDHDPGQGVFLGTEDAGGTGSPFDFFFELSEIILSLLDPQGEICLVDVERGFIDHEQSLLSGRAFIMILYVYC